MFSFTTTPPLNKQTINLGHLFIFLLQFFKHYVSKGWKNQDHICTLLSVFFKMFYAEGQNICIDSHGLDV